MGRFLRIAGVIAVTLLVGAVVAIAVLVLDSDPAIDTAAAPAPEDVFAAQLLVRDLRDAMGEPLQNRNPLQTTVPDLNSAVRLGARFIPGFRGDIATQGDTLIGRVSIPVPWWRGQKWVNLSGTVPAFDGTLSLEQATVSRWNISPRAALLLARQSANLYFGQGFGDTLTTAASAMRVDGETLQFDLTLDNMGDNGLVRNVLGNVRGQDFPTPENIDAAYRRIRSAMDDGRLPVTGSFETYLRFALQDAYENSASDTLTNAYTASVFGLTQACGPKNFNQILGRLAILTPNDDEGWQTDCAQMTLNGRIDSRRHFITSAAIRAAANQGISFSIGEFKELHDTISGAGGFDFTDIAANASGIRLSNYFMSLDRPSWPSALERLQLERGFIITYDGIPTLMPEAEFNAQFGTVNSEAYNAMVMLIEDRIDQLDLYSGAD